MAKIKRYKASIETVQSIFKFTDEVSEEQIKKMQDESPYSAPSNEQMERMRFDPLYIGFELLKKVITHKYKTKGRIERMVKRASFVFTLGNSILTKDEFEEAGEDWDCWVWCCVQMQKKRNGVRF